MPEENVTQIMLSPEQSLFIGKALMGDNILVDACIGSGKTTAIERLCCERAARALPDLQPLAEARREAKN